MFIVRKVISYVIDYFIVYVLVRFYTFCASIFWLEKATQSQAILMVLSALISVLFLTCYVPTKSNGQTLGQKLMKVKVMNTNGKERTYMQNFVRECVVKISFAPIFIVIAGLYFLFSSLFVHKCIYDEFPHDLLLKTKVVQQ